MVSDRTIASVRLWAQNCGAVFPQDADLGKVFGIARRTLSGAAREDLGELQLMFAIGMEPFVKALRAGGRFPKEERELGDIIFEAYKVVSFQTRLDQIYERVVNSDTMWKVVEGHLMRSFRGDTLARPRKGPGRAANPTLPVLQARDRGRSALLEVVPRMRRSRCLARLGQHWSVTTPFGAASPVPYHLRE